MQLLLCAATESEISPIINKFTSNPHLDILITGVGLTAAAYAITKSLIQKRPGLIIQAGIAGCLDPSLPFGKIVMVEYEMIGDLGVEEKGQFHSVFDLDLQDKNQYPWKDGKLYNDPAEINKTGLTTATAVTVNEISTSPERISYYRDVLGAQLETMEGAALHYVALMEKIPFLQVRSLSNMVGERDKTKWTMDKAISDLNTELERILTKYL